MVRIQENELEKINGGATPSIWIGMAIAALIIFISGVIDGIVNPKKCGE